MTAFERVKSGLPGVDGMLDNIRIGDNVVWQVDSIEDYMFVVTPFVKQSIQDGRTIVYMRFAAHKPLVEPQEGLTIYEFNPDIGFELFAIAVRKVITSLGKDVFYVFDSLSDLQVLWATDLMMGNFFRVTCPYLFELDTVAYFPLTRGEHSHESIAQLHDTTQLFINIYSGGGRLYMHPVKAWKRYSSTMFMPHLYNRTTDELEPLTEGLKVSQFYQLMDQMIKITNDQNLDSWDRFVLWAKLEYRKGRFSPKTKRFLCDNMMTRDPHVRRMVLKHFTPEDYFLIQSRIIGSGGVGGKACGMLLARKLVQIYCPSIYETMEQHDSYYVGSDVFYSYIVYNGYWKQRIRQKTPEGYFSTAAVLKKCFDSGEFPVSIRQQFVRMLEYFGQSPIIVRSSSLQEDGFGNAFAGKYESVFCINTGTIEDRLTALENAVRTVYSSTMDRSALEYRRQRGLEEKDEQMAVLIQRVSGNQYKDFFMPNLAGVGYSYCAYRWDPQMDPAAGMLRLVIGLGTQAVDRTGSYPRIVSLDRPETTPYTTTEERHKFSQNKIDVLDYAIKSIHSRRVGSITSELPKWFRNSAFEHDIDAERMYLDRGVRKEVLFASCHGILSNKTFIDAMREMMQMLQTQYRYPVDIEFTVNQVEDGEYMMNLLQCRPLQARKSQGTVKIPEIKKSDVVFEVQGSAMGGARKDQIDRVICVNPQQYFHFPYARKHEIAHALGIINAYYKQQEPEAKLMLFVPGRIGTSSPDLGVPVMFADITQFSVICEVSDKSTGYMPELSYGSHLFQDLVETETFYVALFENENTRIFNREFLQNHPNQLAAQFPELAEYSEIIRIRDVSEDHLMLYSDILNERSICGISRSKGTKKGIR
ncbi:MAG: PEP/pyruvate-binding domain-containing protein [Lachnospiraceae bacterium]